MNKGTVIACHGWGFDASCWQAWQNYFEPDFNFLTLERGYFSAAQRSPKFPQESALNIVLTHSFGLHLCSKEIFEQADMLFIFGGFIGFHPVAAQFQRRSRLVLKQMITRLQENPQKVLKDFYSNVFYPQKAWKLPHTELKEDTLLKDLKHLESNKLDLEKLKSVDKIGILHGFDDAIVPRAKGRELFEKLSSRSKYFEIKESGHALPFTHAEQCWLLIKPEIEQYQKNESS